MSRILIARALSSVGHPALLMPAVFIYSAMARGLSAEMLHVVAAGSVFLGVCIVVYCFVQVRAGRWTHVDASIPGERRQLNLFLMFLFFGLTIVMWLARQPLLFITWPALSGVLVLFGQCLRSWLKVSLHVSFAIFAAALVWPSRAGVLGMLLLAIGVAWSRLVLSRHTPQEIVVGGLSGCVAGIVYNILIL